MVPLTRIAVLALWCLPSAAQNGSGLSGFPGVPIPAPPDGACVSPGRCQAPTHFTSCPVGVVQPPPGWYSGDTHEHAQLCFSATIKSESELRDEMIARGQNVASLLVWGVRLNPALYLAAFLPRITGTEHPSTVGYPSQVIQYGIETSGFDCANLGHSIALGVDPSHANFFLFGRCPQNDQSGDFAKPVVEFFQQNPATVVGYAHQTWPVPLFLPASQGGFDWEGAGLPAYIGAGARCLMGQDLAFPDPTDTNIHPTLASIDVATGHLDFLETVDLYADLSWNPAYEDRWFGLYYKLLNAGQQVAIVGGTDADCVLIRQSACVPQTWVQLEDGDALTYDNWTRALAKGRTVVSDGGAQFLDLNVGGEGPGGQLYVNSGAGGVVNVGLKVDFNVAAGVRQNDTIEIVKDGVVVLSKPTGKMRGGTFRALGVVPFQKSGWVAARTKSGSVHTGAVYVYVDKRPIANCEEAEYFTIYADFLNWIFDLAASVPDPSVLEAWVGCSEPEIRAHIADGRRVYAAARDFAAGLPINALRRGWSSPSGRGPTAIGIDAEPKAGTTVTLNAFNAPPDALGALLLSPWFNSMSPDVILGARLFVLGLPQGIPYLAFPARASHGGYIELPLSLPTSFAGVDLYAQWLFWNTPGFDDDSLFSSSDALELRVR